MKSAPTGARGDTAGRRAALLPALRARATVAPVPPREALTLPDGRGIGSIDAALAMELHRAGLLMQVEGHGGMPAWRPVAREESLDASLERIAGWLREAGRLGRWRNEALDVTTTEGDVVGRIERAAVRALGITTFAVHLIGTGAQGGTWVQQRALDKATDPGLWDTLMGGLRGAGESVAETLERETWEEAGLRIADLGSIRPVGRLTMRRPVAEGYMVEHLDVFEAVVPGHLTPVNRDGEVERFECLDDAALSERLEADRFTLEAALMLCGAVRLR